MDNFIKYFVIIGAVLVLVIYMVLIPMAKRKNFKDSKEKMDKFYNDLAVGDEVVLSDGIQGKIISLGDGNVYEVNISKDTTVKVNKFGIVNKI